ncbi:isopeptide-forming domain-containing fimbrial protein [Collinsella aerofaciens]|uniref:isopeptide-forming domain-containing fimbrial protein n=1 Tax=Collinsella aerofaciens TaxID=74426 RepID=UPI00189BF76C|nr:isopeptide-forming domain-containing fimbrial protein [Collinsella aerofaciens]MDB1863054.1 isopeptide-forming domain-containing fimbrial protein [Collinsella aerofaciens]
MSKNIARLAVTAGLTAALSFGGVMAPVTMAFAEGNTTVTFDYGDYAGSTTYKGIQIFAADVNGSTVKNIQWAGANETEQKAIKDAVVRAIQKIEPTYNKTTAQDAADWLNEKSGVTGNTSQVASDNVLSMIADNLKDNATWQKTSAAQPSLSNLDAGYWLFLTNTTVKPGDKSTDAYSAPVYAVIDGTSTTVKITPKKSVPTVEKKILDDNKAMEGLTTVPVGDWDVVADSQIGQEVNYKLTGTIASNYATYDSYTYMFTDTLSKGLSYVDGQTQVFAVNKDSNNNDQYTDITENFTVQPTANDDGTTTLAIKVNAGENGKYLKEISKVDASTQIVVFYKAVLNGNAVIGNTTENTQKGGNPNTVKLEYSNNPYGDGTGETIEDTVADFAFKLNLKKVDQGTEQGLENAVFTIQSADTNTENQYIASTEGTVDGVSVVEGQLVTVTDTKNLPECVKFTSDKGGKISVSGLDAGSYKVTEIETPDHAKYPTTADPFTFTISPMYDKTSMKVKNLAATVSETGRTDIAVGELDNSAGDNKLTGTKNGIDGATGLVTITVGNTKSVGLPLTGLNGVTFTWIAGGAVLCIGVAHLIRSRKQAEESEQE